MDGSLTAAPRTDEGTLLNRELSWLDLNARVLDLAADPEPAGCTAPSSSGPACSSLTSPRAMARCAEAGCDRYLKRAIERVSATRRP